MQCRTGNTQYFPRDGWVEHDPMQIFDSQLAAAKEAMRKAEATAADIYAIGITNQRETITVWDKTDGKPIYRSIVWQCRRTADDCEKLKADGIEPTIKVRPDWSVTLTFPRASSAGSCKMQKAQPKKLHQANCSAARWTPG